MLRHPNLTFRNEKPSRVKILFECRLELVKAGKEILFFECSININRPIKYNGNRLYYADLESKTNYYEENYYY